LFTILKVTYLFRFQGFVKRNRSRRPPGAPAATRLRDAGPVSTFACPPRHPHRGDRSATETTRADVSNRFAGRPARSPKLSSIEFRRANRFPDALLLPWLPARRLLRSVVKQNTEQLTDTYVSNGGRDRRQIFSCVYFRSSDGAVSPFTRYVCPSNS